MSKARVAVGGECRRRADKPINPDAKDGDTVALLQYLAAGSEVREGAENQQLRANRWCATVRKPPVGYYPDVEELGNNV